VPTQAQQRQIAKHRVRVMRGALKVVDTRTELLDRRLTKLLDRQTLITIDSFDSWLKHYDGFYTRIRILEQTIIHAMTTFLVE